MGRPRKPEALHILEGTFREDRHGNRGVDADGIPERPKSLKGDAKKFWDSAVPQLIELGLAKAIDATQLEAMCQWFARYQKFSKTIDGCSDPLAISRELMLNMEAAWKMFDKIASRFGLSPADRMRLRTTGETKKKSGVASRQRRG